MTLHDHLGWMERATILQILFDAAFMKAASSATRRQKGASSLLLTVYLDAENQSRTEWDDGHTNQIESWARNDW